MKILEDYKKIAQELLFEVDDEKMIKYKDKDGDSKEMKAGSAKTMPKDHPAKQAWDKMQDAGDDSGAEKPKGTKVGGSDFDRDGGDAKSSEPKDDMGDYRAKGKARMEKEYGIEIPDGKPGDDLYDDDVAYKIVDTLAKKFDMSKEYAMMQAGDELGGGYHDSYYSLADSLENNFQEMADEGGHQKYDEPAYDTRGMEKMKYGGDGDSGDDGEKPKPKGKPNYNSKEYFDISGNDTMGHLSREEQTKLVKFFNPEQLRTSSGHEPSRDDLSVDKHGFVRFGDSKDKDRPGDGDIVGNIKRDTTHDELIRQLKNNIGPIMDKYYKQFGAGAKDAKKSEPVKSKPLTAFQSKDKARMEKEYGIEIPDSKPDDSGYDDTAEEIADVIAKKYDISREYALDSTRNELADGIHDSYYSLADSLENNFQEMVDDGGHQRYDEPMYDTQGMEKMKYGESVKPKKKHFLKEQLERFGGGKY